MIQILIFLLILSVVVLIHELGHFWAAKKAGVRVDEFGFGLPPRLFTIFRRGGTDFTINALPIGGFVKLYGENPPTSETTEGQSDVWMLDQRSFAAKKLWQRGSVMVAGVVMNFLLGIVLFSIVYSFLGVPMKIGAVRVEELVAGGPAAESAIKVGDVINKFSVGSEQFSVKDTKTFIELTNKNKGNEVILAGTRDGNKVDFKLTPRVNPPAGEGALGIVITDTELRKFVWYEMPFRGAWIGTQEAWAWGKQIANGLWSIVYSLLTGKGINRDLAGPVGIYQISNQVQKQGVLATLQFVGVLSVNLAILNIMPFPALDGGRLVFLVLELVRGKRIREEIESWVNTLGMILLLMLMALITFNDLSRLGLFGGLLKLIGR